MIVEGSPAQAGEDGPIPPHRRRDPAPQPGGSFDTGDQASPSAETDTADFPDQEQ